MSELRHRHGDAGCGPWRRMGPRWVGCNLLASGLRFGRGISLAQNQDTGEVKIVDEEVYVDDLSADDLRAFAALLAEAADYIERGELPEVSE